MNGEQTAVAVKIEKPSSESRRDTAALFAIAGTITLVHVLTNGRYGFHRDELQTMSDALHLEWGFVAYPPFTPFVERVSLELFGLSLVGLRLFAVIAQAAVIVLTGLMARELGGGRLAQVTAAIAAALSPLALFEGTEFQYTTFDYLWWVLIAYFVIRMLKEDNPRWCLPIGAVIGLGLMTKYTMVFYVAGIVGGLVLTQARRFVRSGYFWGGIALAAVICLPNVIWQVRHGLISLHFLQHIHTRDVGEGRAEGFFRDQFRINTNFAALPLWIAGLFFLFRDQRDRMLGWMYAIPMAVFALSKARFYYAGALYPMLLAMGAVGGERWVGSISRGWRRAVEGLLFAAMALCSVYFGAVIIPFTSSGSLRQFALKNNGDLREEIGWDELVKTVAGIRDSLPPEQRENARVLVGNYGEGGAIEILGPQYHLKQPLSGTNSSWYRGYPSPPPAPLIVVGWSQTSVERTFTDCRLAGHNGNSEGIKNEESEDHPDIFVCAGPRKSWAEFWKDYQRFG
jgi:Dolichyl-phosphate-mannose-protein mannosyltransferase